MRRWSIMLGGMASLLLGLLAVSSAYAAGSDALMTSPAALQQVHFESDADTLTVYSQDPISEVASPSAATWGRAAAEHHTGSYGFWCAGSSPGSFPNYPTPTWGIAVFPVVDTTKYYQSWIQYSYIEPSWDPLALSNPFTINWADASKSPTSSTPYGEYRGVFIPQTSVWSTIVVPRDDTLPGYCPPQTAGYFRFVFRSSPLDSTPAEGASIDDVMDTGYLFGPVTAISAARGTSPHSSVTVSWTPGWVASSTPAPTYAVWRHDIAADTWTEVTALRTTATSCVDTGALVARQYEYAVQPWEGLIGTANWGQSATSSPVAAIGSTTLADSFAGSQAATTAPYGGKVRLTGALADVDGQPVAGLPSTAFAVQSSPDGSAWTTAGPAVASAATETAPGSYATTITVSTDGLYYRVLFLGGNGFSASTGTPSARITLRPAVSAWGAMTSTPSSPKYGGTVAFSAALSSETGAVAGRAGLVTLQTSSDGTSWVTTAAVVSEPVSAVYSATIASARAGYYRLVYAGESSYSSATATPLSLSVLANSSVGFGAPTVSTTTPVFGGAVSVGATLTCESGPVTGRTTVKVSSMVNALSSYTVTATEDVPGHYVATVPVTSTSADALYYRLTYAGDSGQYMAAGAAQTGAITVRAATMSFANVVANPTVVISGRPSVIAADLLSQTGAAVRSADASVTLLQSDDNATWNTAASSIVDTITVGHYGAVIPSVTSHKYFRFIVSTKSPTKYVPVSGLATSASAEVTATADPSTTLSGTFADGTTSLVTIPYGASKKLVGTLRDSGGVSVFGHAADVVVQTSPNGSSSWATATVAGSTVESLTAQGSYEVSVTPVALGTAYYRLAFAGAGDLAPSVSPTPLGITVQAVTTSWSTPVCTPATVGYGSTASIAATLSASTGPVGGQGSRVVLQSSADGSTWTTSSVTVAETAAGRYSATVGPLGASLYYRFRFAGVTGLSAADSASSAKLSVTPLPTAWGAVPASLTYVYGGTATIGSSLSATSGVDGQSSLVALQRSADGVSAWTTATATITEPVPAYYQASFSPSGTNGYYRLVFAGVGGVYSAGSSSAVAASSTPLATRWLAEQASSGHVALGGSVTLSAQLQASAGLGGAASRIALQSSPDGSAWTTVGVSIVEPSAGLYSATLSGMGTPGTMQYRFRYAGESQKYDAADSASIGVTVDKDRPTWSDTWYQVGGLNAMIGTFSLHATLLNGSGVPMSGASVVVETAPASSPASWTTFPSAVSASAGGVYTGTISTPATDTIVRLRYLGDALHDEAVWAAPQLSIGQLTPVLLGGSLSAVTVQWGVATVIHAQLALGSTPTTDTAGATVRLQVSTDAGVTPRDLAVIPAEDGNGVFSATSPAVLGKMWLRLHADHTSFIPEFYTPWLAVTPTTYFTAPALSPGKPTHNKAFKVTGKVSAVPTAWRIVVLKAEHKETKVVSKKKTTVWVVRSTVSVKIAPASSAVVYKASMKVSKAGAWRVRASVSDTWSVPGSSVYRSFTAK